jgi:hypothetical protein
MGIKNFIVKDSYSRIERVDVMKDTKTVDYYLSIYKNSNKSEVIARGVRFSVINDPLNKKCSCDGGFIGESTKNEKEADSIIKAKCEVCKGIGYLSKNDYDEIFEDALKQDVNILSICYQNLMSRPEFANTEEA